MGRIENVVVGGVPHRQTLFLINTKKPDGTPSLCTLIPDDHAIDLAGGEEFMTAFVPTHMLKGKPKTQEN